ncbi:MAG TPA: hypothetical protein VNV16_14995 [Methylibium sp.]|nr:hypothetical protein [Methylibium sp.]
MTSPLTPGDLRRLAEQVGDQRDSQAAFARYVGWDKAHVTRLKQLGHLVLADDGRVVFGASLRRIADHADPGRDAQRQAAADRRPARASEPPAGSESEPDADGTEPKYASSRATKEYWAAKTAQVEYEKLTGELVSRTAVDKAVADAAMQFRQAVENQPHRLADRLVGKDLEQIRALLREDGQQLLGELQRGFAKRLHHAATTGGST